jgi:hypothetical protein
LRARPLGTNAVGYVVNVRIGNAGDKNERVGWQ